MQQVDLTTLVAVCHELAICCLPAKLEQVHQSDRYTLYLCLRTLQAKQWLLISWHPQAARLHLSDPPPNAPDTFTFSQQIWHQVAGLALVGLQLVSTWERVVDLQFACRPGDEVLWHLYVEIMGKYSNAILVNASGAIVTAAHQVSYKQSSVRPIQTGDRYELPPALLETIPTLTETFATWYDRLTLIPQEISRSLLTNYRGLSSALARSLLAAAGIDPATKTDAIALTDWQALFAAWQNWLQCLESRKFTPALTDRGYTVIGGSSRESANIFGYPINDLLRGYYCDRLQEQEFKQLWQQIDRVIQSQIAKLQHKSGDFHQRLEQSEQADTLKHQADLLMAHLQDWQPGMSAIEVWDFVTNSTVEIALDPLQTAVQNAQNFYRRHQKQKRAKEAIAPLLTAVQQEIAYLQQVGTLATQLETSDLKSLQEIQQELASQGYLKLANHRSDDRSRGKSKREEPLNCHRFRSPSGFEIWVGRNNYQNEIMTFRIAGDYDLWFHTQEIPGSHVLLRLEPGAVPDDLDLQAAANLAAYYSQARQSDRVPVIFTEPKYVFKPKGAKPGMVVYKQERVIWGQPSRC
ncbi:NFACT family protein [Pseudanabaena sp. PCC 6802]|uniref:Rqc2 family fibronectin-binding protein n=1 Tax=Pseudanabaena sp. PCC 6802 TaxID=118173 RepID=UPI00034C5C24|nr:NFACT RNA binding domain-containing protein [Pseudanabaena sp. PCC 6802]